MINVDVETLAKELHEAGREAVEKGATVAADHHGEKARVFLGWDEISDNARDGRRIQARYLLERFTISPENRKPWTVSVFEETTKGTKEKHRLYVRANTKSEARAEAKRALGVEKIVGMVEVSHGWNE